MREDYTNQLSNIDDAMVAMADLVGKAIRGATDALLADDLVIAEGGAATTAYARLQFETLNPDTRAKINEALLRYCELDTLAMVMIVQGWRSLICKG